jgi:uncharacterized protein (DUF1697 family)
MTTRVALLRGINLGSHKKVPMARLRDLAESLGLSHPRTYVQSGNLVFETDLDEAATVEMLERALRRELGFEVPVISRSAEELAEIASSHPFAELEIDDRFLHVAFLDRVPDQPLDDQIDATQYLPDRFHSEGREIYLAYPTGSGRSKLSHALLEKKLDVSATSRNWRTVSKLAELAGSP